MRETEIQIVERKVREICKRKNWNRKVKEVGTIEIKHRGQIKENTEVWDKWKGMEYSDVKMTHKIVNTN